MQKTFYLVAFLLIFMMHTKSAQAYLDPGSGSLLFQIIVGGILSGLFAIKLYYRKIKSFFKSKFSKKNKETKESYEQRENS